MKLELAWTGDGEDMVGEVYLTYVLIGLLHES